MLAYFSSIHGNQKGVTRFRWVAEELAQVLPRLPPVVLNGVYTFDGAQPTFHRAPKPNPTELAKLPASTRTH